MIEVLTRDELIDLLIEIPPIRFYSIIPEFVKQQYQASSIEIQDAIDHRQTVIPQATKYGLFSDAEIKLISHYDNVVLSAKNTTNEDIIALQTWLRQNPLTP